MKPKLMIPTNPHGIRPGYHLVRVDPKTEIEVIDGTDDAQAIDRFIQKMQKQEKYLYDNMKIAMFKHLKD